MHDSVRSRIVLHGRRDSTRVVVDRPNFLHTTVTRNRPINHSSLALSSPVHVSIKNVSERFAFASIRYRLSSLSRTLALFLLSSILGKIPSDFLSSYNFAYRYLALLITFFARHRGVNVKPNEKEGKTWSCPYWEKPTRSEISFSIALVPPVLFNRVYRTRIPRGGILSSIETSFVYPSLLLWPARKLSPWKNLATRIDVSEEYFVRVLWRIVFRSRTSTFRSFESNELS